MLRKEAKEKSAKGENITEGKAISAGENVADATATSASGCPVPKFPDVEAITLKPAESCPYCESVDFVKRGVRKNKFGEAQMYLCRNPLCGRTFTARDIKGKKFPLRIIIESMSYYNLGFTLEYACALVKKKFGSAPDPQNLSGWIEELKPLKEYLDSVSSETPHQYFQEGARMSEIKSKFDKADMIVKSKENFANHLASFVLKAVTENKALHEELQRFFIANDSVTVATEVSVYIRHEDVEHMENVLKFKISERPNPDVALASAASETIPAGFVMLKGHKR